MNYYAHTKEGEPESEWQLLKNHLRNVAEIAEKMAMSTSDSAMFYTAGLIHDIGKYQSDFQLYLKNGGRRGSVPHASWGAAYARQLGYTELAFAIDGHHKGLPDKADLKSSIAGYVSEKKDIFEDVVSLFENNVGVDSENLKITKIPFSDKFERELFTRFLYSALIDADWLDTEEFCDRQKASARIERRLDCESFIQKLETSLAQKSKEGELNRLRNSVREYAVSQAGLPPSFYSMNLPTGMGKTLASLSWALHHAKKNNLKRIIIVLPYINIIDQTAKIIKEIFGDEFVLEHHSGYNETLHDSDDHDTQAEDISKQLATENWDYPVIVTTTVQFFESLFSNKRAKCRKIHNIAETVVIFDEVQTLEKEMVLPTLTMLQNINTVMRTSFLFCTATQPAFEKRENFDGIDHIVPLVENCDEIFAKTRRVTYHSANGFNEVEMDDLFQVVAEQNTSALCIFNTKKSALLFFSSAKESTVWEKRYHLSTSMCPHHRKAVITLIRDDLSHKRKILVSSTQLIEAGVDFDFPCVFREYAPMESIIQSAGRCNREGLMPEFGNVFIFKLKDSGAPNKQYRSLAQHTLDMIEQNPEGLYGHKLFPEYYRSALNLFVDADRNNINSARLQFNFETVANGYHLIANATEGLFIPDYNDESRQLMQEIRDVLKRNLNLTREHYRKLQQYSVQVYSNFIYKNQNLFETLPNGMRVWFGTYSNETGISDDPLTADRLVV